jgi:hypothetical protein
MVVLATFVYASDGKTKERVRFAYQLLANPGA